MTTKTIKTNELKPGDVVRNTSWGFPFDYCTVKKVTKKTVVLFRPYVHTSDFTTTDGVICYIGTETVPVRRDSEQEWILYQRREAT